MKNIKLALIYDFDKTLSPKDMQEFHYIQSLGYEDPAKFWEECGVFSHKQSGIAVYLDGDPVFYGRSVSRSRVRALLR